MKGNIIQICIYICCLWWKIDVQFIFTSDASNSFIMLVGVRRSFFMLENTRSAGKFTLDLFLSLSLSNCRLEKLNWWSADATIKKWRTLNGGILSLSLVYYCNKCVYESGIKFNPTNPKKDMKPEKKKTVNQPTATFFFLTNLKRKLELGYNFIPWDFNGISI